MRDRLDKLKQDIMPFVILYIIFDIVIIGSLNYALVNSEKENIIDTFSNFMDGIKNFKFFAGIFADFNNFLNLSFWTLLGFIILFIVWKFNHEEYEYQDIENGSSDWSKDGAEYKKLPDGSEVLNRKGGFILSKYHYLGTDLKKVKINKNILVVGRIWCR
jgi:hypothetical protein